MDTLELLVARIEKTSNDLDHVPWNASRTYISTWDVVVARVNAFCVALRDVGGQIYDEEGNAVG